MKTIFLTFVSMMSIQATAAERLLVCGNKSDTHPLRLEIRQEAGHLEPAGQVTKAPYLTVNLICNNAAVLMELKKDILCAGVLRGTSDEPGQVISESIAYTTAGYKWQGLECR